jgi:hypothetical protein
MRYVSQNGTLCSCQPTGRSFLRRFYRIRIRKHWYATLHPSIPGFLTFSSCGLGPSVHLPLGLGFSFFPIRPWSPRGRQGAEDVKGNQDMEERQMAQVLAELGARKKSLLPWPREQQGQEGNITSTIGEMVSLIGRKWPLGRTVTVLGGALSCSLCPRSVPHLAAFPRIFDARGMHPRCNTGCPSWQAEVVFSC